MASSEQSRLLAALAKAEAIRGGSGEAGKRHYQRFIVRGEAELHAMDEDRLALRPVLAMIRDVGRAGLGFLTSEPLKANSTWRIHFLSQGNVIGQQAMIVRHCREVHQGAYLVGCQFCIETGLLCLLGVDPATLRSGEAEGTSDSTSGAAFIAPSEVA